MKDIDFTAVLLNMPWSCARSFILDMNDPNLRNRAIIHLKRRSSRNDHFVFLISYHLPAVEMVNGRRWSVCWWMSADGRAFDADLGPWSLSWILNTNVVRKRCPKNLPTFFSWIVFRAITNKSFSIPLLLIWSILKKIAFSQCRGQAFAY